MTTESVFKTLQTIDENPNMLAFQLAPTNVAYANTLRRMVLIGVESVGFRSDMNETGQTTDVTVLENTTPMTNEMLADRIGLIPVYADPATWDPEEYSFELKIQNESPDTLAVKASDFEVRKKGDETNVLVPNKEFFHPDPISKDTALIALLKGKQPSQAGQKIHLVAKATVGTGREHIRFSPVSQCSYGYSIDTDEARQRIQFEKWIESAKNKKAEDLKENKALEEALMREFKTMEVQRCYKRDPATGEPNSFDFVVETVGVQSVDTIVERALQKIESKLAKYAAIDKEAPETVTIQPADARMKGYDFIFQKEDHTLGNLLQTYMDETMMDKDITYVGYKVPHPLRDEMVLRVGVNFPGDTEKDGKESAARIAVAKAATECATMFRKWREDWMRAVNQGKGRRTLKSLRLTAENAKAAEQAASLAEQTAMARQGGGKKLVGKVAVR
jgi:DNA-directed RNA polymerase subunit D